MNPCIEAGHRVQVHYTGRLENGTVFDRSEEPVEFTIGQGELIPGFEEALIGMQVGEKKTFTLSPEKAFGAYNQEWVIELPKSILPAGMSPQVGQTLYLEGPEGQTIPAFVVGIKTETLIVDANHPLAGQTLTFEVEVLAILS
ncbi:MAG: FKBP-type peptidyl-prolyl cis-trans isomerase [Bacteroidia bacterium]